MGTRSCGVARCYGLTPQRLFDWRRLFKRLFDAVSDDPEYAMVDGTIVKVHRHRREQHGDSNQAIGRSKGGMTMKNLALTHAHGRMVRFHIG